MVQTSNNEKSITQYDGHKPTTGSKGKTFIIVYEQPKVVVVRHYTKTIIPHVNPEEYKKKFDHVLLDTSTLMAVIRQLNIQENLITPPRLSINQ